MTRSFTNHILFKKLHEDARIPASFSELAAGIDLSSIEEVVLKSHVPTKVKTGLALQMKLRMEAQVRSRSGLSLKGVVVFNAPGTIDADYRGEIEVIMMNYNKEDFTIRKGDRIAQLVFQKLPFVMLIETKELEDTARGSGGFGSTGS